jgi:DNA-binding winged helix-turn-helix (wHTH) protein
MTEQCIEFGRFRLLRRQRLLFEDAKPVKLGAKALEILLCLVDRAGELVSTRDLLAHVWQEPFVEESTLRVQIAALRKALHDGRGNNRLVLNVPGRGYRFVAPVTLERPIRRDRQPESNLPLLTTHLFGRTELIEELATELSSRRLLTIVGAGGIGKTCLALAVAHAVMDQYRNGVCFVDLTSLTDPTHVSGALASALGLPLSPDPIPALLDFLRDKNMLILLDNCEHVVKSAASLAETLLKGAREVHVLASSREPLRINGEWLEVCRAWRPQLRWSQG